MNKYLLTIASLGCIAGSSMGFAPPKPQVQDRLRRFASSLEPDIQRQQKEIQREEEDITYEPQYFGGTKVWSYYTICCFVFLQAMRTNLVLLPFRLAWLVVQLGYRKLSASRTRNSRPICANTWVTQRWPMPTSRLSQPETIEQRRERNREEATRWRRGRRCSPSQLGAV